MRNVSLVVFWASSVWFYLTLNINYAYADGFELTLSSGLSSFDMKTLKGLTEDLNIEVRKKMQLNTEITSNFPMFLWYNLEGTWNINDDFNWGFYLGLVSTGSRIDYHDYSGEYNVDNLVHSINLGILVEIPIQFSQVMKLKLALETGGLFSELTNRESIKVATLSEINSIKFNATSAYIKLQTKLLYRISNKFELGLLAGYVVDVESVYHLADNDNAQLQRLSNKDFVTTGWSGMRFGFLVSLKI